MSLGPDASCPGDARAIAPGRIARADSPPTRITGSGASAAGTASSSVSAPDTAPSAAGTAAAAGASAVAGLVRLPPGARTRPATFPRRGLAIHRRPASSPHRARRRRAETRSGAEGCRTAPEVLAAVGRPAVRGTEEGAQALSPCRPRWAGRPRPASPGPLLARGGPRPTVPGRRSGAGMFAER